MMTTLARVIVHIRENALFDLPIGVSILLKVTLSHFQYPNLRRQLGWQMALQFRHAAAWRGRHFGRDDKAEFTFLFITSRCKSKFRFFLFALPA